MDYGLDMDQYNFPMVITVTDTSCIDGCEAAGKMSSVDEPPPSDDSGMILGIVVVAALAAIMCAIFAWIRTTSEAGDSKLYESQESMQKQDYDMSLKDDHYASYGSGEDAGANMEGEAGTTKGGTGLMTEGGTRDTTGRSDVYVQSKDGPETARTSKLLDVVDGMSSDSDSDSSSISSSYDSDYEDAQVMAEVGDDNEDAFSLSAAHLSLDMSSDADDESSSLTSSQSAEVMLVSSDEEVQDQELTVYVKTLEKGGFFNDEHGNLLHGLAYRKRLEMAKKGWKMKKKSEEKD